MSDLNLLVRATLQIYADALRQGTAALFRHIWIVGLVPAYTLLLQLVTGLAMNLGFAGGFLVFLAVAACASSFLTVIGEAVAHGRVRFEEIGQTFGQYFSRLITVFFMFWIVKLLLGMIVSTNPNMLWLMIFVNTAIFIVFNPIPELIYQGRSDGMAILEDAVQFTRDNLLEWLAPLAILLLPFFLIDTQIGFLVMARLGIQNGLDLVIGAVGAWLPFSGATQTIVATALASILIVWVMLFRGFLFKALNESGRRQRVFASRARS